MAGYTVRVNMYDGKETLKFATLGQVARYLKGRDMGTDYRRPGYLQAEAGQYFFGGFDWADLLDGSPYAFKTRYKAELLNEPVKLRWTRRVPESPTAIYSEVWTAKDGPERAGDVFVDKPREDGTGGGPAFHPTFEGGRREYGPAVATLAEAKAWVFDRYAKSVRVEPEPVVADGPDCVGYPDEL